MGNALMTMLPYIHPSAQLTLDQPVKLNPCGDHISDILHVAMNHNSSKLVMK